MRRYSQKGGASTKGHFRRKYVFARPKYTAEKLHKIREVPCAGPRAARCAVRARARRAPGLSGMCVQVIHKRRREEIEREREKQRKEQEEAANKEVDLGKRKQQEEEEAKAQRLSDLKAKAESLRQEKSTLFGMLKQALIEEAKKKQREEKAERQRKEEQDKKDKKERALAEAAQALVGPGANVHAAGHPGMSAMMAGKMGQMGAMNPGMVGPVPGMAMGYGPKAGPHGAPFLSPRQGFYGTQDSPRGVAPQNPAQPPGSSAGRLQPFPPSQHPPSHPGAGPGYGSPQMGVGGVARSMLGSLQGQNQRFMSMQAYQNQNALLANRMAGGAMGAGRGNDNRPPPPSAPPPMDGRDAQGQQAPQQPAARGRGMFGYPQGGRGFGPPGYHQQERRW